MHLNDKPRQIWTHVRARPNSNYFFLRRLSLYLRYVGLTGNVKWVTPVPLFRNYAMQLFPTQLN